ncbi:histone-lysine N-methyltransferase SETD7 [Lepeophtheirus salmonis]|uniref:histone-lysine N-methyltransferase SETD7 n=1 Tax=Lepeophtheirus salmonis TaxID=72036 RepID=UPI001AE8D231|nr:histone-lysine N-methyltransferase SETD7-like [Lepeophtheirus salmonis]
MNHSISLYLISLILYLKASSGTRHGYFSLCDSYPNGTKRVWLKYSGFEIQAWLKSVIPVPLKEKDILASFYSESDYLALKEVRSTSGLTWRAFGDKLFDGWIYGKVDSQRHFIPSRTYYIFPDYITALIGNFSHNNEFLEGVETRITHYRCTDEVMELKFANPKPHAPLLKPFRPNSHSLSKTPLVRDPLEKRNVYLSPSITILELKSEDSLFARRNITPHSLVAYYNGYKVPISDTFANISDFDTAYKNVMNYDMYWMMNIPLESVDSKNYIATLGHKVNHHFWLYNVDFGYAKHPLYGEIRCLTSTKRIRKGQEIFAHYGYVIGEEETPDWYNDLYYKSLKMHPEIRKNTPQKSSGKDTNSKLNKHINS